MSAVASPMASSTIQMALTDTTSHDIRTILERPVNLGTFEWQPNSPTLDPILLASNYDADQQNYLKQFNFPQDIFASSPIALAKLDNFQYLKADIEIEVKVNAQPFFQGALLLVYNPYYNDLGDFRRKGTRFLASQTSCPYKILNLESANSCKLICPYANIYDMFDLASSNNQFGTVFIYVFAPLQSSAAESVKYTVFARFINPEFMVPTSRVAAMSNLGALRYAESDMQPSSGKDSGEVNASGPISTIANTVATVSDVLTDVPLVGAVASSVAWVARMVSGVASVFGLSKPTINAKQCLSVLKPGSAMIHSEGFDDATTLALLQDNGIDGSSFIPEKKDEMVLSHLFSRPNFFHRFEGDTVKFSSRSLISAWNVGPISAQQIGSSGVETDTLYLGSFSYASTFGTLWRGTINYDIMVVKTCFHQGRFAVVFFPETSVGNVPNTLTDQLTTNYSVICNLKDRQDEQSRDTYRISVPFISNTNWRQTLVTTEDSTEVVTTDESSSIGSLAVYSLVDLSFPPTVASNVTFLVAHSGGSDYQIARPKLQLGPGFKRRYAQSDVGPYVEPDDENLLVPSHIHRDVTAQTTGEYFASLRALVKRFGFLCGILSSSTFVGVKFRLFQEGPTSGTRVLSSTVDKSGDLLVSPTPWYMASFLYRFMHGSNYTKIIPVNPSSRVRAYLEFDNNPIAIQTQLARSVIGKPVFEQSQQVSNAFEIRTPYYRAIRNEVVGGTESPILGAVRTCLSIEESEVPTNTVDNRLYEAAGDDFSFFFQIGPPPMMPIGNYFITSSLPGGLPFTFTLPNPLTLATLTIGGVSYIGPATGVDDYVGPLLNSTPASIVSGDPGFRDIVYDDSSSGFLYLSTGILRSIVLQNQFGLPYDASKTPDLAATAALWLIQAQQKGTMVPAP